MTKRRRVTPCATWAGEHRLAFRGERAIRVGVWRRLERVEIHGQRVQLLVAVARLGARIGQLTKTSSLGDEIAVACNLLRILIERRVPHQVSNRAVPHES